MTSSSLSKNRSLGSHFEVGNNHKSHRHDLGCILDASSFHCHATLATLEQDEPHANAHYCDGVSTVPRVLVISTCVLTISPIQTCSTYFFPRVCSSYLYTFMCSSLLYDLPMPLLPPSSHNDVCLVEVGKPSFTKSSISQLVFHIRR